MMAMQKTMPAHRSRNTPRVAALPFRGRLRRAERGFRIDADDDTALTKFRMGTQHGLLKPIWATKKAAHNVAQPTARENKK